MSKKNRNHNTLSFADLRTKEVVNSIDGKRLGRIIDIVFGARDGLVLGIVVPPTRRNIIFRNSEPMFISWEYLEKIGEDVLLVRIVPDGCWPHRPHRHRDGDVLVANTSLVQSNEVDTEGADMVDANVADDYAHHSTPTPIRQRNSQQLSSVGRRNSNNVRSNLERDMQDAPPNHTSVSSSKGLSILTKSASPVAPFRPGIDCDNNCSKCMLFDCSYRWNSDN
jgi:YlmC/YmxH family sporulation protein